MSPILQLASLLCRTSRNFVSLLQEVTDMVLNLLGRVARIILFIAEEMLD